MNFLEQLSPDQRHDLVRLPYRIGLWVSNSDQDGGEEARAQELQSLSNIIHGFAQEIFSSEDVQRIMSEAINRKNEWPAWADNIESVPDDCRKVMDFIAPYADRKDIAALTNHLMEIGQAVATSFCELENSRVARLRTYIRYLLDRKNGKGRNKSFEEYLSISPKERAALKSVAAALGTRYW